MVADATNTVYEFSYEGNNASTGYRIEIAAPDLVVDSVIVPANAQFGQGIDVTWTATNHGNGPAMKTCSDRIWLSSDTTLGSDWLLLTQSVGDVSPLAAGGSYTRTASVSLPLDRSLLDGSYYIIVESDGLGNQAESNETNNAGTSQAISLTLPPLPDLRVANVSVTGDPSLRSGALLTITWQDLNGGDGATACGWHDRVTVVNTSTGETLLDRQVYHDPVANGAIAPDASQSLLLTYLLPDGPRGAGDLQVTVAADSYNHVFEHNADGTAESNNASSVTATSVLEQYPDMAVRDVSSPIQALIGERVQISWDVDNLGDADATGIWTESVYLSSDQAVGGDDQLTRSVKFPGPLAAGGTLIRSAGIDIPSGISGTRYVVIRITSDTGAYDHDLANNAVIASQAMEVLAPDLMVSTIAASLTAMSAEQIQVTWTVANKGTTAAAGSWVDRVLLSRDNSLSSDDTVLTSVAYSGSVDAGGSYSQTRTVNLPAVTGQYYVLVATDVYQTLGEASDNNNWAAASDPIVVSAPYHVTVATDIDYAPNGTPIPLYGHAARTSDGTPAAYEPVTVRILTNNTRRVITATTDANGGFQATFVPLQFEAGQYRLAADHPAAVEDAVQDQFVLVGLAAAPARPSVRLVPGLPVSGQITLTNLSDVALTGLAVSAQGLPANLSAEVSVPEELGGKGSVALAYTLTAADASLQHGYVTLHVATAEGASLDVPMEVTIVPLVSQLTSNPGYLKSGVVRGQQTILCFEVTNGGGAPSGDLQILLPDSPWMSLAMNSTIPSINPGQKTIVMLVLSPPADLALGRYTGTVVLQGRDGSLSEGFEVTCASNAVGDLRVTVVDDYTFYVEGAPKVEGAKVILRDPYDNSTIVAQGLTDASGVVLLADVQAGTYLLEVSAEKHGTSRSTYVIQPGITNETQIFIGRELITYRWVVVPTEIEDVYTIRLESTFETNVPVPLVTIEAPDALPPLAPGESTQIDLPLTNHGLIAALDVELEVPQHPDFIFTPLVTIIGNLPAKSALTVPMTVERVQEVSPEAALSDITTGDETPPLRATGIEASTGKGSHSSEETQSSSSENCITYVAAVYEYQCGPDRKWHRVFKGMRVYEVCSPDPSGVPSSGGWGGGGGGGGGARGGGGGSFSPPPVVDDPCEPRCEETSYAFEIRKGGIANAALKQLAALLDSIPYIDGVKPSVAGKLEITKCCKEDGSSDGWKVEGTAGVQVTGEFFFGLGPGSWDWLENKPIPGTRYVADVELEAGLGVFGEAWLFGGVTVESECGFKNLRVCAQAGGEIEVFGGARGDVELDIEDPVSGSQCEIRGRIEIGVKTGLSGEVTYCSGEGLGGQLCWAGLSVGADITGSAEGCPFGDLEVILGAETELAEGRCFPDNHVASAIAKSASQPVATTESVWQPILAATEEWQGIIEAGDVAVGLGYSSIEEMEHRLGIDVPDDGTLLGAETLSAILDRQSYLDSLNVPGICATVRMRIDQEAVVTRNAFLGTLEIDNGYNAGSIEGIQIELDIRDEDGDPANDKFGVTGPELDRLTAVDGTGSIAAGGNGVAKYTFIPNREAAPIGPAIYGIGGTLRYVEPGSGLQVIAPLFPSSITVYPDALLELNYFQQRDVIADDPFTEEVEPSEPFTLGLLVHNIGHGVAENLRITSAQPKIIENEKGLLIDFQIIGTQVGDQVVTPSLTADFGNVGPGQSMEAHWLLTSSLEGRFVDYSATFEHVTGLGDPRLSLIDSVSIHELIHAVRADRPGDDTLYDFLVNDDPDVNVLPDRLYLSDGSIAVVNVAGTANADHPASLSDPQVHLTASMTSGWCYVRLPDPGANLKLSRVVRSDGKQILVGDNAWQTDRVFAETDQSYRHENRLHLLDYDSTGSYTLFYIANDSIPPYLTAITQVTPDPHPEPVSSIDVTFSEPIDLSTFDFNDVALTRNGGTNLIDASVVVSHVSGNTYRIGNLAALTGEDGNYQLIVDARGIMDYGENAGTNSISTAWAKGTEKPVVVLVGPVIPDPRNSPVSAVGVVFSKPISTPSFGLEDLTLTRDGGGNLITEAVSIVSLDATSFRIEGLLDLTVNDGQYELTVSGTGVQDTDGNTGIGSRAARWTMDSTAPTLTGITHLATNPRNIVVQSLNVTFSEPIDAGTFDWHDITLTRNGGANLVTNAVTVEHVSGTEYCIREFNWVVGQEGIYVLTVSAEGIQDRAGNAGVGSVSETWVMDTTPPAPPSNLGISPDRGVSSSDGLTNTLEMAISGSLPETGLRVRLVDLASQVDLGERRIDGAEFNLPVRFASGGAHRVQVRLADEAGNVSDAFFDVFIDLVAPTVTRFVGIPSAITPTPVTSLDVVFSEPIDGASFNAGDVALTHNGESLDLSGLSITTAGEITFHLTGLPIPTTPAGDYELRLDVSGISDRAGNNGTGQAMARWKISRVAPVVEAGPDATIDEGSTFGGMGSFTDRDAETWTATVDYGDDSGLQPLALNADKTFALSHVYADNGTYLVTVTVTNEDGEAGTDTVAVIVNNSAPTVNAGVDATVDEGTAFSTFGSFADPGADTWSATVDYGDGSGVLPLALNLDKTFGLSHVYAHAGTYIVAVTVTDDDGGVGSDTLTVTVRSVAPPATARLWAVEYRWGKPSPGYTFAYRPFLESWLEVRFVNEGPGDAFNVTASITCVPVNVTIVDGNVSLGNISAGGSAWSTGDTFRLRVNMASPQDPKKGIVWRVEYNDAAGNHHVIEAVPQYKGQDPYAICP